MTLLRLTLMVVGLAAAIGLTLSNPTMDDYVLFVDQELSRALDRMDDRTPAREQQIIRQVFAARSKQLLESVVRPRTVRRNFGLFSQYKTQVIDSEVVVIGMAGRFIPVKGVEEATLEIGRLAF